MVPLLYEMVTVTMFVTDVLVVSPSWTTYKPQAQLANKRAFTVDTKFEDNWRITPEALEKVNKS